jgi:hypothetical protein
VVVGGIYSPIHQNSRWGGCLSMGAPDSPVRQPCHPTVRVRLLELLTAGPPDSSVVHRTVTVHYPVRLLTPALTLRAQSCTVHCSCSFCRQPLVLLKGKCALGPFLSILVIMCQHKWFKCETMSNGGRSAKSTQRYDSRLSTLVFVY